MKSRFRNLIESMRIHSGTDIGTDYDSVVAQFQIKLEDPGEVRKTLKISRCQLFDGSYYVDELWIIRKKGLE